VYLLKLAAVESFNFLKPGRHWFVFPFDFMRFIFYDVAFKRVFMEVCVKRRLLSMMALYLIACFLGNLPAAAQPASGMADPEFSIRIVADRLSDPWEVTYGPDNQLWVTEAKGYRVLMIDPVTGKKRILLDLNSDKNFPRYDLIPDEQDGGKSLPQGGLMGLALHPALLQGSPYVYVAYAYNFPRAAEKGDGAAPDFKGIQYICKIVRFTYNPKEQRLATPVVLCDTIPGSSDHNGGRLTIGSVNKKEYLFYSCGDMGAGQFANGGRINKAQNKNSYEGKILRFNISPDADSNPVDQWIPNDNPLNGQTQSAVWTIGHRNPQGLTFTRINGEEMMYTSEHGPYGDDEINRIEAGKNYGHPLVIGYNDGNYDGLAASVSDHEVIPGPWHTTYPLIGSEAGNAKEIGAAYTDPIKSFYTIGHETLQKMFRNIKSGREDQEWEAYGPSSIDVYTSKAIPGWENSLLVTTLKGSRLLRIKLAENGKAVVGEPFSYAKGDVRYRDLAISADGHRIYLATDSSQVSSGPSRADPQKVSYRGCILELTKVNR
jgi:PQQ-dependent dehydrogenase (s-GDH family)